MRSLLTPLRLTQHLLARELVSPDALDRGFTIAARKRKNRNFEVAIRRSSGYFAKQPRSSGQSLQTEARFYETFAANSRAPLARYLPQFRDYDPAEDVLILELVPAARDLHEVIAKRGRMGRNIATELARAVAAIHEEPFDGRVVGEAEVPWVLSLQAPHADFLYDLSGANLDLLRIVQQSRSLVRRLTRLREGWSATSLIHGDLRFPNCVVGRDARRRSRAALKLVDWEFAGSGDAAWDVGCVLAAFLSVWISSMTLEPGVSLSRSIRSARTPLRTLQPAIRSFCETYLLARRIVQSRCNRFLVRSILFAAARLIQTAYEQMFRADKLVASGVVLLQVASNISRSPRTAGRFLFGIDFLND